MEVRIIFDREDRLYRWGEVISGMVVVESEKGRECSRIWITYQWRTHGRGNRSQGQEQEQTLRAEKTSFREGESREFPFSFATPNGPVTYHGYLLNVDWYLTAHVQGGPHGHFKSEQDFLLEAGDPTGAVVLGEKEIPSTELPARSPEVPPASNDFLEDIIVSGRDRVSWAEAGSLPFSILAGLIALIAVVAGEQLREFLPGAGEWVICIVGGALVIILLAVQAVFRNAYRRNLELGEVWARPGSLYRGGQVYCHVDFVTKRGFHLRSITASISAREIVTVNAGTTTATQTYIIDEEPCTKSFNEDLYEGRPVAFDCALPVSLDAPPSFFSKNNNLEWIVTMRAEIKGWPAWEQAISITVLP